MAYKRSKKRERAHTQKNDNNNSGKENEASTIIVRGAHIQAKNSSSTTTITSRTVGKEEEGIDER